MKTVIAVQTSFDYLSPGKRISVFLRYENMKKQCNNGDLGDQDLSRWFHHSGLVRKKREAPSDMAKVNFVTIIFLLAVKISDSVRLYVIT